MTRPQRYPLELRERAVRMVIAHRGAHPSEWAAMCSIASKFGMTLETLRIWVRRAEVDGVTSEEKERIRQLEREHRELRRADEFLKAASARESPVSTVTTLRLISSRSFISPS